MSNPLEIMAQVRSDVGKGASRRLRREQNLIPAVVYGAGKPATSLTLDHNKVIKFLESEAVFSSILTLNLDGKAENVVLKAIQRHPFKPKILHIDFMRIKANEKISMHVPLHFMNEDIAPGVKLGGGLVSHLLNEVEVSCLPKDLPEFIEVDLANLEMDQSIHLSELVIPKGVEIIELTYGEDHDAAVVSIHKPRAVEEVEVTAEGAPEAGTEEAEGGEGKEES